MDCGESFYTMEISKHNASGLFFNPPEKQLLDIHRQIAVSI